jgi:hypothetical protein
VLSRDQAPASCKAEAGKLYVMRDSKNPADPRLYFTPASGTPLSAHLKDGAFEDLT